MATKQKPPETTAAEPPQKSTLVALTDRADRVQMRFLAREIRLRDGRYAAIKSGIATVRLAASRKEIAIWGGREGRTAMITAEGYRKLNGVAQITVLTPPSIEIPGIGKMANPYVKFSEETDAFKSGWIRKIAVAPGPLGNLVLCDRTTYLSLVEYLIEDLIGVAKKAPTAVCWGTRDRSPGDLMIENVRDHNADLELRAKKENKDWLLKYRIDPAEADRAVARVKRGLYGFYPVEPITGQGLWFDRGSEAVAGVFRSYAQTGKFGIRKLEAIAYRNVLRDHPLMPGMSLSAEALRPEWHEGDDRDKVDPFDVTSEVQVYFHEQIEDETAIKDLLRDFERGLRTAAFTEVDGDRGPQRAGVTDADAESPDEDEPRDRDEKQTEDLGGTERAADPREPAKAAAPADPIAGMIAQIQTAEEILGAEGASAVLDKHPAVKAGRRKAPIEALRAYFKALNNEIDRKASR